ncbi:MAG: hypothetical protein SGCHY_001487, partial [Lobulomycetales sp.]
MTIDTQSLSLFYSHFYPTAQVMRWLDSPDGSGSASYLKHREFSFTLPNDAYLRYHSYLDAESLRTDLVKKLPIKIDIGAVYNAEPSKKKMLRAGVFKPLERDLVFDIDMTDYDPVRNCCSDADICKKCWKYMTISIRIVDRVLRQDFGFVHLLWIFSGRRGVHCWISDERARKMSQEARRAIVGYLEVVKGGEGTTKKINLTSRTLPPSLASAYRVLQEYFEQSIITEQDLFGTKESWDKILALVPDEEIKRKCNSHWEQKGGRLSSIDKWHQLVNEIESGKKRKIQGLFTTVRDIVFQYTYPRLDDNVSTGLNHLLKSPFCVHPKTGRVCVPIIDPETFDPFTVPTLDELISEHEAGDSVPEEQRLMKPYFDHFE